MVGTVGTATVVSTGIAETPSIATLVDTTLPYASESLIVWNQTGADGATTVFGTRFYGKNGPVPAVPISGSSMSVSRPAVAASANRSVGSVDDFLVTWDDGQVLWGVRVAPPAIDPSGPPVVGTPFVVAQHGTTPAAACGALLGAPTPRCAIAWRDRQSERIMATLFDQAPDASSLVFSFPVQPGASLPTMRVTPIGSPSVLRFDVYWQYFPTIAGVPTPRVRYAMVQDNGLGVLSNDSSDFPNPCGAGPGTPQIGPDVVAGFAGSPVAMWTEPGAPGRPADARHLSYLLEPRQGHVAGPTAPSRAAATPLSSG
jgi:hypothetical protein